jgi:hypothetical protein
LSWRRTIAATFGMLWLAPGGVRAGEVPVDTRLAAEAERLRARSPVPVIWPDGWADALEPGPLHVSSVVEDELYVLMLSREKDCRSRSCAVAFVRGRRGGDPSYHASLPRLELGSGLTAFFDPTGATSDGVENAQAHLYHQGAHYVLSTDLTRKGLTIGAEAERPIVERLARSAARRLPAAP